MSHLSNPSDWTNGIAIFAQHNHGGEAVTPTNGLTSATFATITGLGDGTGDDDGDGLSSADELFTYHTDPRLADTDGDGLHDGQDSAPLNPDADGDGIPDSMTAAVWNSSPFLAANAGRTNFTVTLHSAVPPGASAVLNIGGLPILLSQPGSWPLELPATTEITFSLVTIGHPGVRLTLSNAGGPALWIRDENGVFGGSPADSGNGTLVFPTLTLTPTGSRCVHGDDGFVDFIPVVLPAVCGSGWDSLSLEGFIRNGDMLRLTLDDAPYARAYGTVTLSAPFLRLGTLSVDDEIHRCALQGAVHCTACGFVHGPDSESCWHDAGCAARQDEADACDEGPIFIRVNSDDDNLDGQTDLTAAELVANEDDIPFFRPIGVSIGCCCAPYAAQAEYRVTGKSAELRLWRDASTPDAAGTLSGPIGVEATAATAQIGSGSVSYNVLKPDGSVYRSLTRSFTAANAQILPDRNDDGLIDEDDPACRASLGSPWLLRRRSEPYLVTLRNECPGDATLGLSLTRLGGAYPTLLSVGGSGATNGVLAAGTSATNTPFAVKNSVDSFWIDASCTNADVRLTYAIGFGNVHPPLSDTLDFRVVDTALPEIWVRVADSGGVAYDYSASTDAIYWNVWTPEWDYVTGGYGGSYSPGALTIGDYCVGAWFSDIMEDGWQGVPSESMLHVVDTHLETNMLHAITGSADRVRVALDMARSHGDCDWTLSPVLPDGARLFSSAAGGTGSATVSGTTNVWLLVGSVATNYTITAVNTHCTNSCDSAKIRVIGLGLSLLWETGNKANQIFNPTRKDDSTGNTAIMDVIGDESFAAPQNYLYLVGDASTGNFNVTATFCTTGSVGGASFRCAFYDGDAKVSGTDTNITLAGETRLSVPAPAAATDVVYTLKAGLDANANGILDGNETMPFELYKRPSTGEARHAAIKGITNAKYNEHLTSLRGKAYFPGDQVPRLVAPYARSFLLLFFENGIPELLDNEMRPSVVSSTTIDAFSNDGSCFAEWLTHNSGADFSSAGLSAIQLFIWDQETKVANFFAQRTPFALKTHIQNASTGEYIKLPPTRERNCGRSTQTSSRVSRYLSWQTRQTGFP